MQQHPYLSVNWIDGMKINQSHFISQHNACTYQSASGAGSLLNEYTYGLLTHSLNGAASIKLYVSADNHRQVQIKLLKCKAVTLGGYTIRFEEESQDNNHFSALVPSLDVPVSSLKASSSGYFVVLTVNPYEQVPCGYADPAEVPFRLPFTAPLYSLELIPASGVSQHAFGYFQLPVGRLHLQEQNVCVDEEYTPPCCTISSHHTLLEAHAYLEKFLGKIEICSLQIIQKILQKKQQNDMAAIVHKVCEQIVLFCTSTIAPFKTAALRQPPVMLVNTFSILARLVKNTLDCYVGSGKEELMNYCMECCSVNQAQLEGAITSLTNHQYSHVNISDSIQAVCNFTQVIDHLLANLLKQEYIGRHKDMRLFLKEEIIHAEADMLPRKRKTFLAD